MSLIAQIPLSRLLSSPLVLALGLGILATIMMIIAKMFRRSSPAEKKANALDKAHRDQSGGVFGSLTEALASQIPESEKESKEFDAVLRQAGFYGRFSRASVYAFRFIGAAVPLTAAGIMLIFAPKAHFWPIAIGGGIAAMACSIIPRFYVLVARQTRLREIRNGLADMMDMLGMCLGGGMGISPSLDHVSKHLKNYPGLAFELQLIKKHTEVSSLKTALADFANRIDIPEVRQVSSLLMRGDRLGTSLAVTLLDQADHFRVTRRNMATTAANRTPVILTLPLLFCFAPSVLILLMTPTLLQVNDFFDPAQGRNVLGTNESLNFNRVVETLNSLDQNVDQVSPPSS